MGQHWQNDTLTQWKVVCVQLLLFFFFIIQHVKAGWYHVLISRHPSRVNLFPPQNNSKYNHYKLNACQLKWVHSLGKVVNINIRHVNCQYFLWPSSLARIAFTLLGIEFTRASQVATGMLFHSSMTTELADIWDYAHLHLPLEDPPKMFYWVQVRTHAWPVHHLYPQPLH